MMLGGSIHTVMENAEALVLASQENGLEVNVVKTKYMVMSQDQIRMKSLCKNW